jgi:zinc protease
MFRIRLGLLAASLVPATAIVAQSSVKPASKSAINIPFEKYTLKSGLTVVLSEDHTTPTVAVEVVYHVGSKNEVPGHTGFAHMFEHVMFTGSGHVPYGTHDRFTEGVGGSNNGQTYYDWTRYYETDPSNYLETTLWLESDRMGFLLDSLDETKFKAQRDIVKNERRQSYDNQPNGRDGEMISLAMYPNGHPHSWPVIGAMSDLSGASVEDVKRFFRIYYAPNNATLAIVGDIDRAQTKVWVEKYFADLPRGQPIVRPKVGSATLTSEKRLTFEDRVQVPRLTIRWPSADQASADAPALRMLGRVLAGSRTARLTKPLVYDAQVAANVNAGQVGFEGAGEFNIVATPRPGHTLTELETQIDSILTRLKTEGPTAEELERAKAGQEFAFLAGLESNLGKAFELAEDQTFYNDPSWTFRVEYPRLKAVTADDVKRVAAKYLNDKRVVLSNVPMGKTDLASHADKSSVVTDPLTEVTTGIKP